MRERTTGLVQPRTGERGLITADQDDALRVAPAQSNAPSHARSQVAAGLPVAGHPVAAREMAKEWVTRVRRARQQYTAARRGAGFRHGVLEHCTVDMRCTAAADASGEARLAASGDGGLGKDHHAEIVFK